MVYKINTSNIKTEKEANLITNSWPNTNDKLISNSVEQDIQIIMNIIKKN